MRRSKPFPNQPASSRRPSDPAGSGGRTPILRWLGSACALATVGVLSPVLPGPGSVASPRPVHPVLHTVEMSTVASAASPAGTQVRGDMTRQLARQTALGNADDRVVTLPTQGELVALTWPAGQAPGPAEAVAMRSQNADGTWGSWTALEMSIASADSSHLRSRAQRVGTEPMWVGSAKQLQIRYPSVSHVASARAEFIDPGTSPADTLTSSTPGSAVALASKPKIFTRAQWGADESLRGGCVPTINATIDRVVIHHDAGSNTYTASQSAAIVRSIYAYHTQSLGWCDIGYNVLVDKYGQAFEGRYGGLTVPVQGAHVLGYNENAFGISMLGNYDTVQPTAAGLDIMRRVIAWRLGMSYRNGNTNTVWTAQDDGGRYPKGTSITQPMISGHRTVNYTACPGQYLFPQIPAIRSWVQANAGYYGSPIYKAWAAAGGGASTWGLVHTGETALPWGLRTVFQKGLAAYYTPQGMVRTVVGDLDASWSRLGGASVMGYPWTSSFPFGGGQRVDYSSGRSIVDSPTTPSRMITGGMRGYWFSQTNRDIVGFPRSEEKPWAGGAQQEFERGNVWWSSATGTARTVGALNGRYLGVGGPSSSLRFPKGNEYATATGARQDFQGGSIIWSRANNTTVIQHS